MLLSWQFWPLYLLIAAMWLLPARWRKTRFSVLSFLGFAALAVWILLPAPRMIEPDGPYGVGTRIFRWVDESRPEVATEDPHDRRNVILQVFYPTDKGDAGPHSVYMDGLSNLPERVSVLPRFLLRNFDRIDTHSVTGAAFAPGGQRWPVVIFSPGYGATRSFYTSLITGLASRGLVVLAIDHPYEAGVAELAGGEVVGTVVRRLPNDPDLIGYMTRQQGIRVADIRFALDRIAQTEFAPHLDFGHLMAAGHSFGGASSLAAMGEDRRIQAAVNIDGTPYGSLPEKHLDRPVMMIVSDPAMGKSSESFRTGNQRILRNLSGAAGYRYTFGGNSHYSFSDFPLFFSRPGQWLLARTVGGSWDPEETQRATLEFLTAFLMDPAGLDRVQAHYSWVSGGRVQAGGSARSR
ncbi:alpha/beta hydrolase family protein [Paludibaculum fermentans]|uniref:alpha/beta hydrolase family protein n=1 Tax=Paludibaculum fermentans TaxID=1473598 RepID=UPI003EB94646